jgi:hypothetical protein
MTSLHDVLREHGPSVGESELAAEMRVLVETPRAAGPQMLTSDEDGFLAKHRDIAQFHDAAGRRASVVRQSREAR